MLKAFDNYLLSVSLFLMRKNEKITHISLVDESSHALLIVFWFQSETNTLNHRAKYFVMFSANYGNAEQNAWFNVGVKHVKNYSVEDMGTF